MKSSEIRKDNFLETNQQDIKKGKTSRSLFKKVQNYNSENKLDEKLEAFGTSDQVLNSNKKKVGQVKQ